MTNDFGFEIKFNKIIGFIYFNVYTVIKCKIVIIESTEKLNSVRSTLSRHI